MRRRLLGRESLATDPPLATETREERHGDLRGDEEEEERVDG